ncbi:hypothetical protein [Burkholderia cepacia]|nr:hypothetical protein [Burkholderia cepacia]
MIERLVPNDLLNPPPNPVAAWFDNPRLTRPDPLKAIDTGAC